MGAKELLKKSIYKLAGSSRIMAQYLYRLSQNIEQAVENTPGSFNYHLQNALSVENLIPSVQVLPGERCLKQIERTEKIKVRIIYPSGDSWNNIHSLYDAFAEDNQYQTVVLVENYPKYIDVMNRAGCIYMLLDDYDIKDDCPDILIATYYSASDTKIAFDGCHKFVKLMIAAIPNVVMNEKNTDIHYQFIMNAYEKMEPDFYLVDQLPFNGLQGYIAKDKLVLMGSPQFDEIFSELNKKSQKPNGWDKLQGKCTILWATDHGIKKFRPTNGLTIDCYLKEIFEYFRQHEDVGIIIRPHPYLIRELTSANSLWGMIDYKKILDYCAQTPNVVWDDTSDYCNAFNTSDGYMIDANCSMICAALSLDKPICRLKRDDVEEWYIHEELSECYYYAKGMNEIIDFIEMVRSGVDKKRENRIRHKQDAFVAFDGFNGNRMKSFITNKYQDVR